MNHLLARLPFADALFWRRVKREAIGLAQDYWKDGTPPPPTPKHPTPRRRLQVPEVAETEAAPEQLHSAAAPEKAVPQGRRWHAGLADIKQKLWGREQVLPLGKDLTEQMTVAWGLNETMNALDLTAGLGAAARQIATAFDTYVTGLEENAELAKQGMALSQYAGKSKHAAIEAYDPAQFTSDKHYDGIFARELFYRIADKTSFFRAIAAALKPEGHLAFTDYVLEGEPGSAIAAWQAQEAEAAPLTLAAMIEVWTKLGFDVRVTEDLTPAYRRAVLKGLASFAGFLARNKPDKDTSALVMREIELWALRAMALEKGLRFYRFYAIKT